MSVEQQGSIESGQPYDVCPIVSIVRHEDDTRAFFDDDSHLPYLRNAFCIPEEYPDLARQVREVLWKDPHALRMYCQSVLEEAYLVHQARYDPLTNLPKRHIWLENARDAIKRCETSEGQEWLAVLLIDLGGFKLVNDTRGHAAGDHALSKTSEGLRNHTRHEDMAASLGRMGGDEFAVLLRFSEARIKEQMDREERTARAAKRIAGLLDMMLAGDPLLEGLTVTAVTGCATWRPGMTAEQVLMAADAAMYAAKSQRREAELQSLSADRRAAYQLILRLANHAGLSIDERMFRL